MLNINSMVEKCHKNATEKGFWAVSDNVGEKLMLIVTEVAEAMEEVRKKDFNHQAFAEELADIVIRTADLAGKMGVDLESIIIAKMEKNANRPYLHGKTR